MVTFSMWCAVSALLCAGIVSVYASEDVKAWSYECINGFCQKTKYAKESEAVSLATCALFCSKYASLWPKPTGKISYQKSLAQVNLNSIDVLIAGEDMAIKTLVNGAAKRFKDNIDASAPQRGRKVGGRSLVVTLKIEDTKAVKVLFKQDESYKVNITLSSDGRILADITAKNFFGARHGLESLNQIIIYDDIRGEFQMPDTFYLEDAPVYPHRGILLDTSRNYISVDTIKRTIEGMAASKLNVFHWHITDSHSFPFVSKSVPKLSKMGAYNPSKIYTAGDIADIIEFARIRGVRVLPEFDAPAHVGEGWQDTDFLACFNKKPWQQYCVEPPCGQLDPTKEKMYDMLELIYKDMIDQFDPDVFHMGGDEVNENCWNSEKHIVQWMTDHKYSINQAGFMKLWDKFQTEALKRFRKHRGKDVPIIVWTSTLTDEKYLEKYLPNSTYIIQIWTTGKDEQIKMLLEKGYQTILSNYDALYFDCGFGGWVQGGNNWCSPYIGWQEVYKNSPAAIAGKYRDQMLGAEATLWTEQVDDSSVDGRLWPRASAMAERLWAEPTSTWEDAEDRMLIHRERLINMKIMADSLEPQWCRQHQGSCPMDGPLNKA